MAAVDMPSGVEFLRPLVGVWEGEGSGLWAADPPFRYRERLTIAPTARPMLTYVQPTWSVADGAPRHSESGYLRAVGGIDVEFVVAQPTGFVETHAGTFEDGRLALRMLTVTPTPTALPVTWLERTFTVAGDRLEYLLRMAMRDEALADHLAARLVRVGPDSGGTGGDTAR